MIAVPCMASVPTGFLRCLEYMRRLPDTYTSVSENTLIHDARNEFASLAITQGFDRVLWIDSDMSFAPDTMVRLAEHLDDGRDMVCGLYYKRVKPTAPVIYARQERRSDPVHGEYIKPIPYLDPPHDKLFEVDACGFGMVMMSVPLLKAVWDRYGPPFSYYMNLGEDMSFCYRVREMGQHIWCDPTIRLGHIGQYTYTEDDYIAPDRPSCNPSTAFAGQGSDASSASTATDHSEGR